MKTNTLKLISLMLGIALLCACIGSIPVSAEGGTVQPRLNNLNSHKLNFNVTSTQTAKVLATYSANTATFTQAKLTVEIQKQVLWFFWTTVDIGTADNKWVSYSANPYGEFSQTFAIDGAGTYRAIIKLEVTGTDGTTDVVEQTIESSY